MLKKWLNSIVNVLYTLSATLGDGIDLPIVTDASVLTLVSTFLDPVAIAAILIC